jgi:predicted alpha/beta-hydrolase family hydrolase
MKMTFYNPSGLSTKNVAIYCHGLTQSSQASFSKEVLNLLCEKLEMPAVAFDFGFTSKDASPSMNWKQEIEELDEVFRETIQKLNPQNLFIVGKSVGGVVALGWASREGAKSQLSGIAVLGLPLKLGYPPKIAELKKSESSVDYKKEYAELFARIGVSTIILQGELDDLGGITETRELIASSGLMSVVPVPHGGHNLEPFTDDVQSVIEDQWQNLFVKEMKKLVNGADEKTKL